MVIGPQWSQTRMVSHLSTGSGGMKRSTLAYGMPRKPIVPSWSMPFTRPDCVLTTIGSLVCARLTDTVRMASAIVKILFIVVKFVLSIILMAASYSVVASGCDGVFSFPCSSNMP